MIPGIDIVAEIKGVIDVELEGLAGLRERVGREVARAVEELFRCRGKVILTGMGKSGLVAKKVASTMSSIGTPAIFLHPAEGMHGDLGMIEPGDVVIAIGKSGESSELNSILPVVRKIGARIIGITGNAASTLGRLSDILIDIGDVREACPYNIAPTTSTTASLVIGDALAVVLMKMRGFALEDFARLHPGGRLGKRLILTVDDVMLKGPDNPLVRSTESMKQCLLRITEKQAGAVSVVDEDGRLLGLVTDYDIRKHIEREESIFALRIEQVMNPAPVFTRAAENAFAALELMQKRARPISVMPVLDHDRTVLGMLRLQDLVRAGL